MSKPAAQRENGSSPKEKPSALEIGTYQVPRVSIGEQKNALAAIWEGTLEEVTHKA